MNRILAVVYAGAALFIGWQAAAIALIAKDLGGWVLVLVFAGVAAFLARGAWKDWNRPDGQIANPAPRAGPSSALTTPRRQTADAVPLELQIARLADAGLLMVPGRTINELLLSWPREDYEDDPYNLLLFMYGSDVEEEPWGRPFCERGWNFDMECLAEAGDYARAFTHIVRITGRPGLVTDLSDDFNPHAGTATIRYTINGSARVLKAVVDNDWADPEAVAAFVKDIEAGVSDGRRFWAADNGQASVLFFITEDEANKVNALRPGVLERYVRPE